MGERKKERNGEKLRKIIKIILEYEEKRKMDQEDGKERWKESK
jgi:hypothetical protein